MSRSSVAALAAAFSTLTPAVALAAAPTSTPTTPTESNSAPPVTGKPLTKDLRVDGTRQAVKTRKAIHHRAVDRAERAQAPSNDPRLAAIRSCESGGDYSTNTGNGFYGGYQFDLQTWRSVGGSGLPSDAPPAEQDRRATMLLNRSGSSPWPVCGQ